MSYEAIQIIAMEVTRGRTASVDKKKKQTIRKGGGEFSTYDWEKKNIIKKIKRRLKHEVIQSNGGHMKNHYMRSSQRNTLNSKEKWTEIYNHLVVKGDRKH